MTHHPRITGWSHTKFGKSTHPDVESLIAEVSLSAIEDAELDVSVIDGAFVGVFNSGFSPQSFEAALLGTGQPSLAHVPATRLESACATGSAALFAALDFIESGRGQAALVVGAEKMTGSTAAVVNDMLLGACYRRTEADAGSFAAIFGTLAQQYFQRYGDQREALALIAAKNHRNGVHNPFAHIRKDLGFEFCATVSDRNPRVAGPLLRTDCSMVSDGAAALVVTTSEVARSARRAVAVRGRGHANDSFQLSQRPDPLRFDGATAAFQAALAEAGAKTSDLDLLETHDCFTIAELLQYEAFGLAEAGKGAVVLSERSTYPDGTLPTNVSGGLKAKGHPVGATGVSQHVMAALQLTGEAGSMQLPTVDLAAVFNMGGAAVTNYATILERV